MARNVTLQYLRYLETTAQRIGALDPILYIRHEELMLVWRFWVE